MKIIILGAALALLLASCSKVSLLNATIPTSGYSITRDIAYGDNPRQKMDIYVPEKMAPGSPVIVFFYGGGWDAGAKADYLFAGQAFASKGFITVIPDYRLYPEVYYPEFTLDSARAVAFAHEHVRQYGGNPDNLFVAGHSAGAHNAMMAAVHQSIMKTAGIKPGWIKGVIGISGPYDFTPQDPKIVAIFSKAKSYEDIRPVNFIDRKEPPMLLATGDDDDTVDPDNTRHAVKKLQSLHSPVEEKIYPGVGHIGTVLSLARGFRGKTTLLEDIDHFVTEHSKP